MGHYIAHKRRKIRRLGLDSSGSGAIGSSDAVERGFARRRETERLEEERSRAAKMARALGRRTARRSTVVDGTSGRRHTAARVAGVVLVSATIGLRTHAASMRRLRNAAPSQLWEVDIRFENEGDFAFEFYDPRFPAEIDVMRLMRYAAPRLAEEMLTGVATAGADDGNGQAIVQLAESYVRKSHARSCLSDDDRRALAMRTIAEFERTVALRLEYFHAELFALVDALMRHTRISRRECERILSRIYAGREACWREKAKLPQLPPPSLLEAS